MPVIYLRKELYDKLIKRGKDPNDYVNKAVEESLDKEMGETKSDKDED